jgi:hypothetical protein
MKRWMIGMMVVSGAGLALAQTSVPPAAVKNWTDTVTVKGDLRYRYESIMDDSKKDSNGDTITRERNRIRARLGAEAKPADDLKVGVELSTGQSDPVSGNQTEGDGFMKKDMKLNLAYLEWSALPSDNANEAKFTAGKMKNPFINVSDLIWDGDLTPEGVAFKGQMGSEKVTLLGNAGYLWVKERSAENDDSMLYAGQGAVKIQFVPEVSLLAGVSYYAYDNMVGYDVIDWENNKNAYGNSTMKGSVSGSTTNKAYQYDYTPIEYFAELNIWAGIPISLYGQMVSNDEVDDLESGYLYGVLLGKAKNKGTFEMGYAYAKLEKDAVVGAFTDSDRWGGGTDGNSHKIQARYQITKNLQVGATYFTGEKLISDDAKTADYDRLQVDLVAAF